jgi:NADPH-dependent glutamate synthase beta subunit-like oxidoreductase/NAD-dependent dihydropyrimidine dehydrogenase PreA subunit
MNRILSRESGHAWEPGDFDWLRKNVPCRAACPAGTDIPGYLAAIARGDHDEAYRINLRDNVFPGVLGRVCSRPCEPRCRHGWEGLGEPVAICSSKRAAADLRKDRLPVVLPPLFGPTGKRIAVVGAGAAGLAAARDLALFGHRVTVFERSAQPGGMMRQGIPRFRLPREVVDVEIRQIEALPVEIRCGVAVGDSPTLVELQSACDAVILAAGTAMPLVPRIPGTDLTGVAHGLQFLTGINGNGRTEVGRNVVVVGGGFTAIDCARSARMLGASKVSVYYRRSTAELSIMREELDGMAEEGIPLVTLARPVGCIGESGRVRGMRFVRTRLHGNGEEGKSGQRVADIPGSEFEVEADQVLLATGQSPDRSWVGEALLGSLEPLDPRTGTSAIPGLFVAGDFVLGPSTLIAAIGQARRCARTVDAWLMGTERIRESVLIEHGRRIQRSRAMDLIPRQKVPAVPVRQRRTGREVETGFAEDSARREAQRCYLCHYKYEIDMSRCIYCDQCVQVKPRPACIVKVERVDRDSAGRISGWKPGVPRLHDERGFDYFIDQENCIRCDACLQVCPVQCIDVQKVSGRELCGRPLDRERNSTNVEVNERARE